MKRIAMARGIHLAILALCVVMLLYQASIPAAHEGSVGWVEEGYQPPWEAILFGAVAFGLASLSCWYPASGMVAITLVTFGIRRYSAELEWAWTSGFQTAVVILCGAGMLISPPVRQRLQNAWNGRHVWPRVVAAMFLWSLLCEGIARLTSDSVPGPKHHVLRMIESLVVLLAGYAFFTNVRSLRWMASAAVAGLALLLLQVPQFENASDVAFVMAPMACLFAGLAICQRWPAMILVSALAACCSLVSIATANRGANVGLLVGLACLLIASMRTAKRAAVVILMLAVAGLFAFSSPLRPRIQQWIDAGWETPTLKSRLEFWETTLQAPAGHLVFGSGPGRGGQNMSQELELSRWRATHNSVLEILDEQGIIGAVLWLLVWGLALLACFGGFRSDAPWVSGVSLAVLASLLAMFVGALAVSRHDDIRMFWLLGLALALGALRRKGDEIEPKRNPSAHVSNG
ncbi:O-Antigen ligase [Stieleria maiorica]|uniref:O-Antigen ligase n=1 Tax=Stieleria maiorica TaxID=2795974 RepID=A0A5B9MHY7_9BACT|nr:O-antigen ligase family protein [Stieleria maiorica]QEF99656.1 O-Antigen ligase [Stieleria maiorica]